MATAGKGQNKSAFLRDLFQKSPDIKEAEATEAWQKAGNEGVIGTSLFHNVRAAFRKQAGGGSGSDGGTAAAGPRPKSATRGPKAKKASQPVVESRSVANGESALTSPGSGAKTGDREQLLVRVEDGIDDLIVELKQLGGMEEALEALRKARRVVVRSHEG